MARIKYVLNERRLAYEGAVTIVTQQRVEEKTKAASLAEQSREAERTRSRAVALEKLRRASGYRRRKTLSQPSKEGETSRQSRDESRPATPTPPSSVVSAAASLFPPDRPVPR